MEKNVTKTSEREPNMQQTHLFNMMEVHLMEIVKSIAIRQKSLVMLCYLQPCIIFLKEIYHNLTHNIRFIGEVLRRGHLRYGGDFTEKQQNSNSRFFKNQFISSLNSIQ